MIGPIEPRSQRRHLAWQIMQAPQQAFPMARHQAASGLDHPFEMFNLAGAENPQAARMQGEPGAKAL
jgi:hypothetical protein